jgi:hypothetical protein
MSNRLFLLFNHSLTSEQIRDARDSLQATLLVELPPELKELWGNVPPDPAELRPYLTPIVKWLKESARPGDLVLVQGEFGASYLMVKFAFDSGLVPVYATTKRVASETLQPNGAVVLTHQFKHLRFRRYGK